MVQQFTVEALAKPLLKTATTCPQCYPSADGLQAGEAWPSRSRANGLVLELEGRASSRPRGFCKSLGLNVIIDGLPRATSAGTRSVAFLPVFKTCSKDRV